MAKAMSNNPITSPSAENLAQAARKAQETAKTKGLPPVHLWNPPLNGVLDMRIARDGTWFYQGSPINRPQLVRLFSTILRRDGDIYHLVTPAEKWVIAVDDAPFVAIDFEVTGAGDAQKLTFDTNVGDMVVAGRDNPIRVTFDGQTGEPSPYVHIRAGLEALIDRKSFYRLIDLACHHDGAFGLWSDGVFFAIMPSDELTEE